MVKKTTLSNGIRIVTKELPHVNSVTLGIWVKTGSRNERPFENGISHFVEHLLFKGTPSYSARDISEALEDLGGQMNAFTTKEYTCYYVKVLDEFFFQAVDILVDMFFNSLHNPEDIRREKGVVAEEIRAVEDAPDEIVHDCFAKAFWGDQPLGRTILGTIDTVMEFDRDMILDYINRQYIAQNIVISACGKMSHNAIVEKIGPVFESASRGNDFQLVPPETHPSTLVWEKPGEQVQVCLGTPGMSHSDKDLYPLIILNNIMGGGLSSRLFQEIREERGLVYSIYSYTVSYFDSGLWCIHAGAGPDNLTQVLDLCIDIIQDVKKNGVTEVEIERSKRQIRGELLLSMESSTSHMTRLGRSEINYNRVIPVEEMVEKILGVTPEEISDLSGRLFVPENFSLAVVGPYDKEIKLSSLGSLSGGHGGGKNG